LTRASPSTDREAAERRRQKVYLATLEADAAYFQARLEILGQPATNNQRAQQKTFELLLETFEGLISKAKRRMPDDT
jgi:hypothetical protein